MINKKAINTTNKAKGKNMPNEVHELHIQLDKLDKERRVLINKIKNSLYMATKVVSETLDHFIEEKKWYVRIGKNIFDGATKFKIHEDMDLDKVLKLVSYSKVIPLVPEEGFVYFCLNFITLSGITTDIKIGVSCLKAIRPQVFQSMVELQPNELKTLEKFIIQIKKKNEAEEKRKALKAEIERLNNELKNL